MSRPPEKKCGWSAQILHECSVEYSDALWTWHRWEWRERGKNRETGESVLCIEFVPHIRTRREYMIEFRAKYELLMPKYT